jgi:FtsP/CotA-like multicopper oxidase with cupredoxin domain
LPEHTQSIKDSSKMTATDKDEIEAHALLPVGRGSDDDTLSSDEEDWEPAPLKQSFLSPKSVVLYALLLVFSIITVLFALTWRPKSIPHNTGSQESQNAYLLDPQWDYEAPSTTRHYHWTIQDTIRNPDGVYRPMIVINGQFPGPIVECNEGDTLTIHVDNKATNATSIHWHGLYQNGSNWMDGTVGITQCPIAPAAQFVYNFTITGQSGTYWYHAHHSLQASDGLFGPLIIHARNERQVQPMTYATDRVVMVHDHYYDPTAELLMTYLEPDRENAEPIPDTALINGNGIRDCQKLSSRKCDNSSAFLQSFAMEQNQNHRLRFINVGVFAEFQVQIDEHEFAVTEVDGTDVVGSVRYHRLNILPAQRYSIILTTNTTGADSFWLRARMVTTCFAEQPPEMEAEVRAIIQYTTSASGSSISPSTPSSKDWADIVELECRDLNTTDLHPVVSMRAPQTLDATINLRSNFEIRDWRLSRGFINETSWRPNLRSPSLYRAIAGLSTNNVSFNAVSEGSTAFVNDKAFNKNRELVYQTTGIQTLDIVISNFDDGAHPFHLHGYKFWVLASGVGYFDPALYSSIDLTNPLRRDTATIEAFGWVLLRFVADNPGMWAFHCHISWHSEAGLLMQFLTRSDGMEGWVVPSEQIKLCGLDGAEKGKAPDDEIWFGDMG